MSTNQFFLSWAELMAVKHWRHFWFRFVMSEEKLKSRQHQRVSWLAAIQITIRQKEAGFVVVFIACFTEAGLSAKHTWGREADLTSKCQVFLDNLSVQIYNVVVCEYHVCQGKAIERKTRIKLAHCIVWEMTWCRAPYNKALLTTQGLFSLSRLTDCNLSSCVTWLWIPAQYTSWGLWVHSQYRDSVGSRFPVSVY